MRAFPHNFALNELGWGFTAVGLQRGTKCTSGQHRARLLQDQKEMSCSLSCGEIGKRNKMFPLVCKRAVCTWRKGENTTRTPQEMCPILHFDLLSLSRCHKFTNDRILRAQGNVTRNYPLARWNNCTSCRSSEHARMRDHLWQYHVFPPRPHQHAMQVI